MRAVLMVTCGRQHPDRPSRAGAEGSRKSRDRQRLRSQLWKGVGLRPPGENGRTRAKSSRTPNSSIAALPLELQRIVTRGCDAGFARGEGLCRRLAAAQRTRGDRHSRRDEARVRGAARPARRGARARQGRARRLPGRGAASDDRQAAAEARLLGAAAAQQARRTRPGRAAARTGDTVGRPGAATRSR